MQPGLVDRGGVPDHRRRLRRRLPRPRLAEPAAHEPGGPLHPGARRHRVGDDAVRVLRGLRPSPAAQRGGHRRASCCWRTWRSPSDQLPYLIAFTAVSLFLLIEMHAFDERATWLRRRIGDPSPDLRAVPARRHRVHPRRDGGLAAAHPAGRVGARSPAPGTGWTTSSSGSAQDVGRLFPVGGDLRGGGGVSFGSTARISDRWFSDDGVAFTATVPAETEEPALAGGDVRHLRAQGAGSRRRSRSVPVEAGEPLLAGTPEDPVARVHDRHAGHGPAGHATTTPCCSPRARRRPSTVPRTCSCSATTAGSRASTCRAGAATYTVDDVGPAAVRRGRDHRQPARGRDRGLPGRHRRAGTRTSRTTRWARTPGRCSRPSSRPSPVRGPVRPRGHDAGLPAARDRFTYTTDVTRRRVRRRQRRRVLRADQTGLLPPLRVHHGDPAAGREPRQPDPDAPRPGVPARDDRVGHAPRPSATRAPTPGSRSTSRATAGSRSTRPVAASGSRP